MSYRFIDHTAELQLELEAPTREDVFREAVAALGDLLAGDGASAGEEDDRGVCVQARDNPALLVAWLDELVFLAESEGLVPSNVVWLELGAGEVRGRVSFRSGSPPHLVKGVTYHDLAFTCEGETWRARVVLDV